MIRFLIVLCLAACCACTTPPAPDTTVIVGATLLYRSEPSLDHSVVVVKDGRIAAVGSQQMIPIPPGSTKIEAYGKYLDSRRERRGAASWVGSRPGAVFRQSEHGSLGEDRTPDDSGPVD